MRKIDTSKLVDAETVLTDKYGAPGTESRREFEAKARAYYYGVILRDRRKELKMTQSELADKVGTARSYIARNGYAAFQFPANSPGFADRLHSGLYMTEVNSISRFFMEITAPSDASQSS